MKSRVHNSPNLIYSAGTQVVVLKSVQGSNGRVAHPAGAVGVIVRSPQDRHHSYRVRFVDDFEAALHHDNLMLLAEYKQGAINDTNQVLSTHGLFDRVIYRCVVGSRAFGLGTEESDTDRRGVYLPSADLHWSLYGVPEQLENERTEECYWELQKFLVMALKGNPNILECLYTPLIEFVTPLGQELLAMREAFLSRLVYQTYNGYVMSQFKRMEADLRNQGKVKPKHVMHLIRLLLSGIHVLREGFVPVDVGQHRERLFAIKNEEMAWDDIEAWRKQLHAEFDRALEETNLPERPDYERANEFLVKARRLAVAEKLP
ncbi:DNA polymerase beta superfamily protein [Botrimarina mediterranea]|uniref:Putative nucleotidyltransferase n=1 Tax=Botrimarina mediterranea TaxID=2528022 RepID=A0A518K7T1_9BACT|nr:nucleotidyltransferase domain-containing protein [Botrimarina mediterranea]QDV73840.1 putative nucleotidyltransferase [Botrimarina mediterranea]QDV78470.1 putative nucleotidyltransferase [Planctomycetes bacterium K2D]